MKKNVASQIIGAQMIQIANGSAFAGTVVVYVTGNGGTQGAGTVGGGTCTNEGNGFYSYAPGQAETNFDHVAFTFTGTAAIPVTIQVYPSFPQTADVGTGSGLTAIPYNTALGTAIGTAVWANASRLVTGGTINAGTITTLTNLPTISTDWLSAAGVSAAAVTKIQTGLATPTNLTAGTITTVTNVTGTVSANLKQVNSVTLTGTGVTGDKWVPA